MRSRFWLGVSLATLTLPPAAAHDAEDVPIAPYRGRTHQGVVPPQGAQLQSKQLNLSSSNMTLLSLVSTADLGESGPTDIWGYTSPSGREYGIVATQSLTHFVEITSPQAPVVVSSQPGPSSGWHDMKTFDTYAYAVSEGGQGIQVFDLSQIDSGVVTYVGDVTVGGATNTHNVVVDDVSGFLYRVGTGSGMLVYDLNANPAAPQYAGAWTDTYVHDAQAVTYPGGNQYVFCCTPGDGLTILDATNDKDNMPTVAQVPYPSEGYSHEVWISEDRQYAYLADELDETSFGNTSRTMVFDISNLAQTTFVGTYTNGNTSSDHNLFVKGDLIYCSNYASGMRVFDRSADPTNPVEIAYYDTYPSNDDPGFSGLWGAYPFFDSGVVIGSDRSRGMFVLRLGPPSLTVAFQSEAPELVDPSGQTEIVTITEATPGNLVPGSEELHYDDGSGLATVPLTAIGGGQYEATFPALPCGQPLLYFVSAQSTDGLSWFDPPLAPSQLHSAIVADGLSNAFADDMETDTGWTSGAPGDDATTGLWTRVDPIGTGSQPEDDYSPGGTLCWVTGQGSPGGSLGENDVDDGTTTLLTPVFDLSSMTTPLISYSRWYSNDGNGVVDDRLVIEIDSGSGWVTVESIGPGDPEASGGWVQHQFFVTDFVTPTASVQMRFRASDTGSGSIVEAAIDDFLVDDVQCQDVQTYCTAKASSAGCVTAISTSGGNQPTSGAGGFFVTASQVQEGKNGLLFGSLSGAANLPFNGGTLCMNPPTKRGPIQSSGGDNPAQCDGAYATEVNDGNIIPSGLDAGSGTSAWYQYWYRDPMNGAGQLGTALSNAVQLDFQ